MSANTAYSEINTNFSEFNLQKVREYGEALMLGRTIQAEDESASSINTLFGAKTGNELILWLSRDFKKHSLLVKILTSEITIRDVPNPDYIIDFNRINAYGSEIAHEEISNIINTIQLGGPLFSSEETVSLAKQVAAMAEDNNINSWASKLASDIGKGKD